jgi:hypothetical protein
MLERQIHRIAFVIMLAIPSISFAATGLAAPSLYNTRWGDLPIRYALAQCLIQVNASHPQSVTLMYMNARGLSKGFKENPDEHLYQACEKILNSPAKLTGTPLKK